MPEYIERETVKEYLKRVIFGADQKLDRWVDDMPAADVRPNVKSEWHIMDGYPPRVYCLNCYKTFAQANWGIWEDGSLPRNFCSNCGAELREASE